MELGNGYSSDKSIPTGTSCLNDYKLHVIGLPQSVIKYSDTRTGADVAKDLGISADISYVIYPRITGNAAISFAKYVQDDQYSQAFIFLYQIELGNEVIEISDFGANTLNNFGKHALNAGLSQFRESCGDKFISQYKLGARLYVSMKLNFASTNDKESFSLALGGKLDLMALTIDMELKIKYIATEQNLNLKIDIAAYQEGGEVIRLTEIFGKNSDNMYYVMSCDVTDMSACSDIIQGIINYAKLDFKDQIVLDGDQIVGNPSILGVVYTDYTDIGLEETTSIITEEVREIRKWMADSYKNHTEWQGFLQNLLYDSKIPDMEENATASGVSGYKPFNMNPISIEKSNYKVAESYWTWNPNEIFTEMRFTLIDTFNNITDNLLLLESKAVGITKCFQDPGFCKYLDLKPVDTNSIEAFAKSYQVISSCVGEGIAYGYYFMPVDKGIYTARSMFHNSSSNGTIYPEITYQITPADKSIKVVLFNNELSKNNSYCNNLAIDGNYSFAQVYKGEFEDSARCDCSSVLLCKNFAEVTFIEVDSPF